MQHETQLPMAVINLKLPDDLEAQLAHEAELEGKSRSEVACDAIAEYLVRREKERFMTETRAAYGDERIRREAMETAEAFLPLDNEALDAVEGGSRNPSADETWWK